MTIKNKPDKETLYKLYVVDELSPSEIAEIYGCSAGVIRCWIKDYGICLRNRKEAHNTKRILKHDFDEKLLYKLYITDDLSAKDIAKIYDCTHVIIKNWLKKQGYGPKLCKCGCGGYAELGNDFIKYHHLSGENNPMFGKHHTDKSRKKISDNHADVSGENNGMFGRRHTDESRKKIGNNHGSTSGENNGMFGKQHTDETKQKISRRGIGRKPSHETRKNMSESKLGDKNGNWKGGISFGKYCKLFNNAFKRKIRNKFHNKCFLCGKTKEQNGKNLDVHHVNYDKDCICNSSCEFIPLCRSCHIKTNFNRNYWEDLIMCYLYPERYFIFNI